MTERRFCTEVSPGGRGCGVEADLIHARHFNKAGEVWDTSYAYRPDTGPKPIDWLWEQLGIDPERVSPDEFRSLVLEFEKRRRNQMWAPPQTLGLVGDIAPGLTAKRPCRCCGCTGGTVCFHGGDATGCAWDGPGR